MNLSRAWVLPAGAGPHYSRALLWLDSARELSLRPRRCPVLQVAVARAGARCGTLRPESQERWPGHLALRVPLSAPHFSVGSSAFSSCSFTGKWRKLHREFPYCSAPSDPHGSHKFIHKVGGKQDQKPLAKSLLKPCLRGAFQELVGNVHLEKNTHRFQLFCT